MTRIRKRVLGRITSIHVESQLYVTMRKRLPSLLHERLQEWILSDQLVISLSIPPACRWRCMCGGRNEERHSGGRKRSENCASA